MFKEDTGDGEAENIFPFPLFTTCLHMIVQFSLASLVLFAIPSLRPRHDSLNPHAAGTRIEPMDAKKPLMTKWFYISRIGPCGVATGMDIGLGNMSLKFITLTFFSEFKTSIRNIPVADLMSQPCASHPLLALCSSLLSFSVSSSRPGGLSSSFSS